MKIFFIGIVSFLFMSFLGNSADQPEKFFFTNEKCQARETEGIAIKVFDETTLEPIDDAIIHIFSDSHSVIGISARGGLFMNTLEEFLGEKITVTVTKENYTLLTFYHIESTPLEISAPLRNLQLTEKKINVTGTMSKWQGLMNYDNKFDFGIFVPFINLEKLMILDPKIFMGPPTTINLAGPKPVPGNFVIPNQTEYLITVNKPDFIMPLNPEYAQDVFALSARVPVTKLISALSQNNLFMALEFLSFRQLGIKLAYQPTLDYLTLPLNFTLTPKIKYSCNNMPAGAKIINLVLLSKGPDSIEFVPSAIEVVNPAQPSGTLTVPKGIEQYISPVYHGLSVAAVMGKDAQPDSLSLLFKRDIDANKQMTFNDYLPFFQLAFNKESETLTNTLQEGSQDNLLVTLVLKISAVSSMDINTSLVWKLISPTEFSEIALPSLPEEYGLKNIIATLKENEYLTFIQMLINSDERASNLNFSWQDILTTMKRMSLSAVSIN